MLISKEYPSALESAQAIPLREQAADALFQKIFSGEYGSGSRLVLNRIANELGISATPVREAMVLLESLGLLSFRHNCGATVKPFGVKQVREVYQVWSVLNSALTRMACGHVDWDALMRIHADILSLQAEPESEAWFQTEMELDHRLEQLIENSCGCRRLVEEVGRYRDLTESFRKVFGSRPEHQRESLQAHLEIVEALLDGDPEIVVSLVSRHNYWCMKSLLNIFRHQRPDAEAEPEGCETNG